MMDIRSILERHRLDCGLDEIPAEWWLEQIRFQRNCLLKESDWTQLPDASCNKEEWAFYRQQLRDLPNTVVDPENVVFPTKPA